MKKNLMIGLFSSVALLAVTSSCSDDYNPMSSTSGKIDPQIDLNSETIRATKTGARDASPISVNDLALKLTSADGTFSQTWTSVTEFETDKEFKVGAYTMEASYGSLEQEGFDSPYYFGSAPLTVRENQVTPVALTAKLANSMVSVAYTNAFKDYFTSYSLQLHAEGGDYINYAADETRPAYLRPGKVTILATVMKPNGVGATLEAASFVAQAQHHYTVTIDVNGGSAGEAQLVISFDELIDQEEITIDLSDELLSAPAPQLTVEGFDPAATYNIVDGMAAEISPKFNVIARGGIGSVTLTTESASLIEQGWPAEIDLVAADAAKQAKLKSLGLNALGVFGNVDKMAVIDLTNVLPSIKYRDGGNNNVKFTLVVKDKIGKLSDPVSLNLISEPVVLGLSNPSALPNYVDNVDVQLDFNGVDVQNKVKFEYKNERGTWNETTINSISAVSRATSAYIVNVTVPSDENAVELRAKCGNTQSAVLTIERGITPYNLKGEENDVFATHATLTVIDDSGNVFDALPSTAKIAVSTDGNTFSVASAKIEGSLVSISGLNPSTRYYAIINGGDKSKAFQFVTEADTQVPNGDFEDLSVTLTEKDMLQGGQWSISSGINYDNKLSYTISEPNGWASVNKKTTSGSTRNSWFVVPSTFNSTLSWSSTVPKIKVLGTGGGTETPASYQGFTPNHGSVAMVVRNVAWDQSGTRPGVWKKEFASSDEYYNHTEPTISNVSAGKLFLGSYDYSNGSESFNEGTSFNSRPSSLKGFYTYSTSAADANEKAKITISLLNGETVIGSGSVELAAANGMTEFNVPVTYVKNAAKATSLRIMISSSNYEDESQIKTDVFNYRYESARHGATLVVDNLSFNY